MVVHRQFITLTLTTYLILGLSTTAHAAPPDNTPFTINGQLNVCGTKLCNQYNQPIQLRGVGNGILERFPTCLGGVNQWSNQALVPANTINFDAMAESWGADIVRLGVSPDSSDHIGYLNAPDKWNQAFDQLINAAYERGMYVLVDWHVLGPAPYNDPFYHTDPNNANNPHKESASTGYAEKFFRYISEKHNGKNNILYEIANEPNENNNPNVLWPRIKEYAEYMIPIIRANDPDGIIIVGTEHWSQWVSKSADNPITGPLAKNVMYTIHWYPPTTNAEQVIPQFNYAVDKIPLFATEWGGMSVNESDKTVYTSKIQNWVGLLNSKKVSWITWYWAPNGSTYSFAYFKDRNTCTNGPFTGTNLTEWGSLAHSLISTSDAFPTPPPSRSPSPSPVPGDTNGDGYVDTVDYTTWHSNYGKSITGSSYGDFNNSGKVDGTDYIILINNYEK